MNSKTVAPRRTSGSKQVRILMADPDASLRPAYRCRLLQEGFELITAASGLDCVTRLFECVPDVLVLEPQLPWGGGDGVLAMMGEVPELAKVPVMVLTSCRDASLLEAISRFPIVDYQPKPLTPERLAGRLRGILAHPKLRFTLAEQNGRLECSIAMRTDGRVYDLRVENVNGRIVVRGRCDSHYVKQLALAAVMEAFEASESQAERVEMNLDVAPIDGWQAERCALSEKGYEGCSHQLAYTNQSDLTKGK